MSPLPNTWMPDEPSGSPSPLVQELLQDLDDRDVSWCQWKSTIDLDRAASGASDLDLLVSRADQPAVLESLGRLGFREADPPPEKSAAGTRSFFGYDPAAPRLIHAHVHYLLMVGHDLSKGFRLPLEREYLSSVRRSGMFCVPSPDLEYIAFVIRLILQRGTVDTILRRRGRLPVRDSKELEWLERRTNPDRVREILTGHLKSIDPELFGRCRTALGPGASVWQLWRCGRQLRSVLADRSPRSPVSDAGHRLRRTLSYRARKSARGRAPGYTPVGGGLIVAAVGSDGAGKSTALRAVEDWLSRDYDILRVHLGRPPWSRTTYLVRGGLKLGRMVGSPFQRFRLVRSQASGDLPPRPTWKELAQNVCVARDRRRVYRQAAEAAARGRIVLCDRFPLPGLMSMDGPQVRRLIEGTRSGRMEKFAMRHEERSYEAISPPDVLVVLRIPTQLALDRKPEDQPERVRQRSREILGIDWSSTGAVVLDAARPATEIAAELKQRIWREV